MKKVLKKLFPERLMLLYHYCMAWFAAIYYGFPSKKMVVVGVTGTKGKTSTANFIWAALRAGGYKTGVISTANIRIGEKEFLNTYHMTMPGAWTIQKLMAQMVREGSRFCVLETTSEGIKQYRHVGVYYDIAVFTNLSPEHLQAHEGSFEKYKAMKGKLFGMLSKSKKRLNGQVIEKVILANRDDASFTYFLAFKADKKITFGVARNADCIAHDIKETDAGVEFSLLSVNFKLSILGKFNVYNALPAIAIARLFGVDDARIREGLLALTVIPGRMERIEAGQSFTVLVDYAHEKESIMKVLETANRMKHSEGKVIILLGAEGGGRDKAKRPIMGEIAAKLADYVVVSNVDPYDDDPREILEDIALASEKFGKMRNQNLFVIEDRRQGIRKAISLASAHDVVLITGKGAEQSMIVKGVHLPWDDRSVVREELKLLFAHAGLLV